MTEKICPICGRPDCSIDSILINTNDSNIQPDLFYSGNCNTCGQVRVSVCFVNDKVESGLLDKSEFMGYLKRHSLNWEKSGKSSSIMPIRTVDDLKGGIIQPSTPLEQVDMLIEYFENKQTSLSEFVLVDSSKDYPICFAKSESDFCYIINSAYELGYIRGRRKDTSPITYIGKQFRLSDGSLMLTPQGWEKAQQLKEQSPYSKQVFVAFHFDQSGEMKGIFNNAIAPAVSECGLEPYTTLDDEHGNSIDDVIIANIRKSRIVIADVTYASQNVYYEAGFAYGLGIPVILTCRENRSETDMKFDTSHIKHIIWKDENDFKKRLINRIEAMGLSRKK